MKEKTDNIDILEELKEWFNNFDLDSIKHKPEEYIQAISNLIAENKELKEDNEYLKNQIPIDKIFYYSYKEFIPKSKVKELIKEIKKYVEAAEICIEEKIIIADSDSLNYGRKEAHRVDLKLLQSLLGKE